MLLLGAPAGFARLLGELPGDARFVRSAPTADLALLFARNLGQLEARLDPLVRELNPAAKFWIAWPKKTSELALDLDGNVVRDAGLRAGLDSAEAGRVTPAEEVRRRLEHMVAR